MKAAQWIDRAKQVKGWESDYKAAKSLGITSGAMSQIRKGHSATLGEETAIKVAMALGMNPAGIILDQVAERTKSPEVRTALAREVDRLCILCKVTVAAVVGIIKPASMRPAA